ncbi:MAG: radical SAM protein [Deltaproteobacteria bacterium]
MRRKWKGRLPVALVFANTYRVGMSNLGFQILYGLLNKDPDIVCERVFLSQPGEDLRSVESTRPLADFPLLFVSFSFEADFINFVAMMQKAGIQPLSSERRQESAAIRAGAPLVIGGGVATFINPEPLAPFVDLFVVGEAEPVLSPLLEELKSGLEAADRVRLLRHLVDSVPGCYVPAFYTVTYKTDQSVDHYEALDGVPLPVQKVVRMEADVAGHSQLYSPEAEFSDLHLAELGRGCSRGCRFCAAGFVYRPPRLWPTDAVLAALAERPQEIERIGLLGMEMTGQEQLDRIAGYILDQGCSLSFSSLRADALSASLLQLLAKSNLKTATIAPDGASERLRRVINKGISEEDVLAASETLFQAGLNNLKLYVMIGLPTEEDEDIEELVALLGKLRHLQLAVGRIAKKITRMNLSVNCFIPKAWTPFQYASFAEPKVLKKRLKRLRERISSMSNVRMLADKPENSLIQAVLARGDRRLAAPIMAMASGGSLRQAMERSGLEAGWYAMRQRPVNEQFPWEIIDHGINRQYLYREYRRALAAERTAVCQPEKCHRCGVC